MTAVLNRSVVPSQVCIGCHVELGSAEKSVRGVRGRREGPLHNQCATPVERRLEAARDYRSQATNGNGASARRDS